MIAVLLAAARVAAGRLDMAVGDRGDIQTSVQAGGMASVLIRASVSRSSTRSPSAVAIAEAASGLDGARMPGSESLT